MACRAAGQKKPGNIQTSQRQEYRRGNEQDPERPRKALPENRMALGSGSEFQRGRKKPPALLGAGSGDVSSAHIFVQHRFKPGLQSRLRLLQRDVLLEPAEDLHPARAAIEHRGESRNSLGRHDSRNPERWNLAHVDAMKCRRRNPDNRHGVLVYQHPMTVVGVAAPAFHGIDVGEVPSLWIPAVMSAQAIPGFTTMLDRRTRWMQILGRLKQNVSLQQAQTGLQPWFKSMLDEDMRRTNVSRASAEQRRRFLASTLELTPAPEGHSVLRHDLSRPLWVLFVATAVLLALACLNVAGLFLARGSARHREISTRLALGASRGRIGRQLLADSVLLAFAGGLLGVVMAPIAVRALIAFLPRNTAANNLQANIDTRLLLFAFLVSLVAGFLAGSAPALQAGRKPLDSSLRERGGTPSGGLALRRGIVTAQIAFTLILVIAASLFVRTLSGLLVKGPGFDTSSLISFGIKPALN